MFLAGQTPVYNLLGKTQTSLYGARPGSQAGNPAQTSLVAFNSRNVIYAVMHATAARGESSAQVAHG